MQRLFVFLISSSVQVFAIIVKGIVVQMRFLVTGIIAQVLSFQEHVPVTSVQTGAALAGEPATLAFLCMKQKYSR